MRHVHAIICASICAATKPFADLCRWYRCLFRSVQVLYSLVVALWVGAALLLCPVPVYATPLEAPAENSASLDLSVAEREFLHLHNRFRVHVERGYHPFVYVEQGLARGFGVDLTNILAQRLGIEVEYVTDQSWEEGMSQLKRGGVDIVLSMIDTPARREFAHFTTPFLTTYTGMATRVEERRSTKLEDFAGRNVGVIKGYWHENVLARHYPNVNIVTFSDHVAALEGLAAGRVDAVLSSNPVLTYHIRKRQMLGLDARPILGSPYFRATMEGYGVRIDMPLLASALQKGLESIDPHTLAELRRRWFIDPIAAPNSLSLSVGERRHLEDLRELRLCVDPGWMPLGGIDPQGNYTGLGADYIALLEEQLPIPVRVLLTTSWLETLEKAQAGECDILSLVAPTTQGREYLNFTRPFLHLHIVVATRGEEIFIEDLRQMSGRRLGSTRGHATTEEFRRRYPSMDLVEVETVAEGVRKVQSGELYGFIGTVAAIGEAIRTQGLSDVKISGGVNITLDLGLGVRKDDPLLRDILDRAIVALGPNEGPRLYNRWVTVSYRPGVNVWIVALSGLGAVLLLAGFIWRNRYLAQLHRELLLAHQELEEKSLELKRLSITDPLTGLYNRLKIETSFAYERERQQRYSGALSIVLIDIDHFKKVNDTFGHHTGDRVLCGIADTLRQRMRKSDIVGRWGGEEFMLILPETTLAEAAALAQDLRHEITQLDFSPVPPQSASFGVASVHADDDSGAAVFQRADRALYRAKDGGRNMVVTEEENT